MKWDSDPSASDAQAPDVSNVLPANNPHGQFPSLPYHMNIFLVPSASQGLQTILPSIFLYKVPLAFFQVTDTS